MGQGRQAVGRLGRLKLARRPWLTPALFRLAITAKDDDVRANAGQCRYAGIPRLGHATQRSPGTAPTRRRGPGGRSSACASPPTSFSAEWLLRHTTRSEEHTSELQSLMRISYAVFCLNKKKIRTQEKPTT